MVIVRGVHRIGDGLNRLGEILCLAMLAVMVIITGLQIIFRVFFKALTWSDELVRYLLVWSSFLGASCVYRSGGHISVTIVQNLLPEGGRKALQVVVHLLCAVFFGLMVYFGIIYAMKQARQLSPAMRIPMSYLYASIPAGGVMMLWHAVDAVLQALFPEKKEEDLL